MYAILYRWSVLLPYLAPLHPPPPICTTYLFCTVHFLPARVYSLNTVFVSFFLSFLCVETGFFQTQTSGLAFYHCKLCPVPRLLMGFYFTSFTSHYFEFMFFFLCTVICELRKLRGGDQAEKFSGPIFEVFTYLKTT